MQQRQGRVNTRATWLDRAIGFLAPQTGLRRLRARVAHDLLERHYEGAAAGRRTQGWNRSTGDANATAGPALARLRDVARDLVRNNANAKSAVRTIGNHVVGWGIVAKPKTRNQKAADLWEQWAGTTACDSEGQNDFYGLQKLAVQTVVESGEVLIRRRFRRPEDGLPIPMQLQVLDPDYLDTSKNGPIGTGLIVHGVEFDALGKRSYYWLFREHPGSEGFSASQSVRVPAEGIVHVYRKERPGQVRGVSWFAPVLLRFKDFDEYEDATLMKQKIAACLAVITSNKDGVGSSNGGDPAIDSIEPGMILGVADGQTVNVIEPPSVREYSDYTKTSLRAIATGLGVTYEDLTGDYSDMPFSAARMSRLSHWDRVEDWRWQMLIPQFCDPAWAWAMQVAGVMGLLRGDAPAAEWTPPPAAMIDPANEGLGITRNIRAGIQTLSGALRERGYIPEDFMAEMASDNKRLDELGIILDSDARLTTQSGGPRTYAPTATVEPNDDDPDEDEDNDAEEEAEERARAERSEERSALVAVAQANASRPIFGPGAIQFNPQVDARTTIEKGAFETTIESPVTIAEGALRVDARTTIADGAVRTDVQLPLTVAETVMNVPAGRHTVERDRTGLITALVAADVPAGVTVVKPRKGRE